MVRKINFIIMIICFSFLSCQTASNVEDKLLKKNKIFNIEDFPFIKFDKLYIMEGIYNTNKEFELIQPKLEIHRGSEVEKSNDYLIINKDGTVDEFYAPDKNSAKLFLTKKKSNNFFGILYKEKNKVIIEAIQAFKMGGGYGTYKQYLKIVGDKIYLQDGYNCSVYILAE